MDIAEAMNNLEKMIYARDTLTYIGETYGLKLEETLDIGEMVLAGEVSSPEEFEKAISSIKKR